MKNLSDLLNKFTQSLNRDSLIKKKVIEAVKNKTNITLPEEVVSVKNGVLEINSSPSIHSEIRLKEEAILQELRETTAINFSRVLYK